MTAVDLPAVPRVLIAEADPWSRDLLEQVLLSVRCDARLDLCADGKQALFAGFAVECRGRSVL